MPQLGLTAPETQFLLDCCRSGKPCASSTSLDWKHLEARASASGLGALFYTCLKQTADAPADTLARSRALYMASAAGNLRLVGALAPLLKRISAGGLPVMLLKGSALLATVYNDHALRPMGDVDVLIRRQDIPALVQILAESNMIPATVKMAAEQYASGHHHWIPYVARDGSLAVELHFDLVPQDNSVSPRVDDIWRTGREAMLGGAEVLVPSPAHLLLHLAIHACTSPLFEPPLRGFHDMAQTIRAAGADMDWSQFTASAKSWNASRQAWCGLHLAEAWMSAGVPPTVLKQLEQDCGFRPGERAALHKLASFLAVRPYHARGSNAVHEGLFETLLSPGGMIGKLPAIAAILWKEATQSAQAARPGLPRWALPFYVILLHPFHLLTRKGR